MFLFKLTFQKMCEILFLLKNIQITAHGAMKVSKMLEV